MHKYDLKKEKEKRIAGDCCGRSSRTCYDVVRWFPCKADLHQQHSSGVVGVHFHLENS